MCSSPVDWSAGWPVRKHSLDNIAAVPEFEALCARHGARSTWFTNWSVMNDAPSRDTVLGIGERDGVEIGMHIHHFSRLRSASVL